MADGMLRRLKCPNDLRETVVRLVRWHDRPIPPTEAGVRRALRRLGEEDLRRLLEVKRGDDLAHAPAVRERQALVAQMGVLLEQMLAEDACFSLKQLALRGGDLLALGFRGPAVGAALETLLDGVVEGRLPNCRETLMEYAQTLDRATGKLPE